MSSTATFSPLVLLDNHGDIVGVNQSWRALGDRNGVSEDYTFVGKNYVDISEQGDDRYGDRVAAELRLLLANEQTTFTVDYPCHSPNQKRWFRLYATTVSFGDGPYYLLVHQRLDRDPPPNNPSASEDIDTPRKSVDHRDRNRLVTYDISPDESATDGILLAFDAIGIDLHSKDTTLADWTDLDVINTLQTSTSDFDINFTAWNYSVRLTSEQVSIYTPDHRPE